MAENCTESVNFIGLQTVSYVQAAATAALLFDFCITFGSEVRWTWGRKWGIVRIAFVISRYVRVVSAAVYLYYTIESTRGGIANPRMLIVVLGNIDALISAASCVLLVARTYAFCGGEKRILITISSIGIAIVVASQTIITVVAIKSKCFTDGIFEGQRYIMIMYGLWMIYELALMSLTLHKRFKFYRLESSPLIATVYRDGVVYMLCMALATMVNCIGMGVLPLSYIFLFFGPQQAVQSVLTSRVLFNLRAMNDSQDAVIDGLVASRVVFAQPIQTPSGVDHLELWDITDL